MTHWNQKYHKSKETFSKLHQKFFKKKKEKIKTWTKGSFQNEELNNIQYNSSLGNGQLWAILCSNVPKLTIIKINIWYTTLVKIGSVHSASIGTDGFIWQHFRVHAYDHQNQSSS
jgi:hypothetical protein